MKRACTSKQKDQRRAAILTTAAMLFHQQSGSFPSVKMIAHTVGIAEGTIYTYFKTKEDIFLILIEDYYNRWMINVEQLLKESVELNIDMVIDNILEFLIYHPSFYRLCSYRCFIELNNSDQLLLSYHQNRMTWTEHIVELLITSFDVNKEHAYNWVIASFSYLNGLWEMSYPPDNVKQVLQENQITLLLPEFEKRAKTTLRLFWDKC